MHRSLRITRSFPFSFLKSALASIGCNYNNSEGQVTPPGGVKKARLVFFMSDYACKTYTNGIGVSGVEAEAAALVFTVGRGQSLIVE